MPTAAPALASNESRIGGRPPCAPWAEPGSGRSTTSPSACRSATRLETVERLRPVRRAISARLIWPSSRSARITRRRLRRRSDSSEPARPGGMESVSFERTGDVSSTARRLRPPVWAELCRRQELEERLVAQARPHAGDPRAQTARELIRERLAGARLEPPAALEE